MRSIFSSDKLNSTESVDIIEKIVYEYLKPFGFKRYGRTLHRYVDGDISQVINFQNGSPSKGIHDTLWVNIGIRIPECAQRKFTVSDPIKKYYHEYECNIRTRLGTLVDGKDTFYNLKKDPNKIGNDIVNRIIKYVMPVFDVLNCRESILKFRKDYAYFDEMNSSIIPFEEAFIYGRKGDIDQATLLFNKYYQEAYKKYKHDLEYGTKKYLRKGEILVYYNVKTNETEKITATKNGYVILYNANHAHLSYLEELSKELGISLSSF